MAIKSLRKSRLPSLPPSTLKSGLDLGLWMLLGYYFQSISLQTTSASRSAFLLYLNVKLVPAFKYLLTGAPASRSTVIGAIVAFAGTALLCLDSSPSTLDGARGAIASSSPAVLSAAQINFSVGDLWSIAAAAASAMFIIRLESATRSSAIVDVPSASSLNFVSINVVFAFSLLFAYLGNSLNAAQTMSEITETFKSNALPVIYLGSVTTALANWLQALGQKDVTAENASLIYALDPVWGAAFANLLLGERLGDNGVVGAGLIFIAAGSNAIG